MPAAPVPQAAVLAPVQLHREPIYFIKEDATLSPGAYAKLKLWVRTWGTGGRWFLECPELAGALTAQRVSALRTELQRLGVGSLETVALPEEPESRYDPVYVKQAP